MQKHLLVFLTIFTVLVINEFVVLGVEIPGTPDQASGSNWQSAYMDLHPARDFKKGDRLVIRVEGSAEWVKVRLLPQNANPAQPTGIVGPKMKVPAGGRLVITLREDRLRVAQISVHAGKEAWGELLNPKGGDIRILGIDVNP